MRLSFRTTTSDASGATMRPRHTLAGLLRGLAIPMAFVAAIATTPAPASAAGPFTNSSSTFTGAENTVAWGDYDGDNDLDLLSVGRLISGTSGFADVYDNNGGFTAISASFPQVYSNGSGKHGAAWGDFDNDGDMDVFITGEDAGGTLYSVLYENSGGTFTAVTFGGTAPKPVNRGFVAWGDFDNDGDLDLFLTGNTGPSSPITTVYRNDGLIGGFWTFTDITSAIVPVQDGSGAWGDYDSDGDLDLAVTGTIPGGGGTPSTILYQNNAGIFINSGAPLLQVTRGSLAWGDYDNDMDLDLIVSGLNGGGSVVAALYQNTMGTFSSTGTGLPAVTIGSLAWGDYDNDGNLDLVATGDNGSIPITEVYAGDGAGNFSAIGAGLPGLVNGEAVWGDYDNDGLLDLAICGYSPGLGAMVTRVYRNTSGATVNTVPNPPTTLNVSTSWKSITATWSGATDAESSSLHYNMNVYDLTAGITIESPMADVSNGYRFVPALGNANHNTSWTITNLIPGHSYYVCVQSIDGAFAGSEFLCTNTITLPDDGPDVVIYDCPAENGSEPDVTCGAVWNSQDIWVRTTNDGFTNFGMQSPAFPGTNYIYVRLTNIGAQPMAKGRVYVYWAKYAAGAQGWSWDWVNRYLPGNILIGDLAGYADVLSLASSSSTIVEIPWTNGPDPSNFGNVTIHGCLLARFVADDDPLTFLEGTNALLNTQNNNNIGWKNFNAVKGTTQTTYVDVGNPFDTQEQFNLNFNQEQSQNGSYLNNGSIRITMPDVLFNRWQDAGSNGTGITWNANGVITLTSTSASIDNLEMGARERFTLMFTTNSTYNSELAGQTFTWNTSQATTGGQMVGGVTTEIEMPQRPQGKLSLSPESGEGALYNLSAQPNPTRGSTTIGYTLPDDASVSVEVYDASGRLIRTLIGSSEQKRGSHRIEWDGLDQTGARVAAGTYFYRLETGTIRIENQIKMMK